MYLIGNRLRIASGALPLLVWLAGCDLDVTSRVGGHPEVAGVELVAEDGEVLRPTVSLPPGSPHRITARFLDRDGRPIESLGDRHWMSLRWDPVGSATSVPTGLPLTHDVTVLRPCTPPRQVTVGYGHDTRADERIFGPFPVEVTARAGSARIFGPEGEELTPSIRLPSGESFRIEVRFYDCEGELMTGLEERYELLLFFSRVDFASWRAVAGEPFRNDVTIELPAGTTGLMSVGLRRIGTQPYQTVGPFQLRAY